MRRRLALCGSLKEKKNLLLSHIDLEPLFTASSWMRHALAAMTEEEQVVFYEAVFLDKGSLLPRHKVSLSDEEVLRRFADCMAVLLEVERFYEALGGLIGYHAEVLSQLYIEQNGHHDLETCEDVAPIRQHTSPPYYDMRDEASDFWHYAYQSMLSLNSLGEVYTVGGSGDRLNLLDERTGQPKPAAHLKIFGKTLLERLFDDVAAREYWKFCVTGELVEVPIVLMTSLEKNNDIEIEALCQENNWFGRNPATVFRVIQPLAPLVDKNGFLVARDFFQVALKPGGHGVIWKLAKDVGVYDWLRHAGVRHVLIRQINNPISSMDGALLALPGQGMLEHRSFGFASCPMREGFHEGLNVLERREEKKSGREEWCLSNIEYVIFERLRQKKPELFSGTCPANVNLLFANIDALEEGAKTTPFPGLIVNMKNEVEAIDARGEKSLRKAARLESTMQNISEAFSISDEGKNLKTSLKSFIQLYDREKILSATKRTFHKEQKVWHETPVSFLYDWVRSTRLLLATHCAASLPGARKSFDHFLSEGPEFLFTFAAELGPLWAVIGQKMRRLALHEGAFLHVGLSQIALDGVTLEGGLVLETALPIATQMRENRHPRVFMRNVVVRNEGGLHLPERRRNIDSYLYQGVDRAVLCHIWLEGESEVWMEDIEITGPFSLSVPDRMRAIVRHSAKGDIEIVWESKDMAAHAWSYEVTWKDGRVPVLSFCQKARQ